MGHVRVGTDVGRPVFIQPLPEVSGRPCPSVWTSVPVPGVTGTSRSTEIKAPRRYVDPIQGHGRKGNHLPSPICTVEVFTVRDLVLRE